MRAEGLSHAALVCSTIASGRIDAIDSRAAEAAPGVIAVITHANAPRMQGAGHVQPGDGEAAAPSDLPIIQDDRVHWNGQPVAIVVAETLEQAEHAASLVTVELRAGTRRACRSMRSRGRRSCRTTSSASHPRSRSATPEAALAAAAVRWIRSIARPGTTTMPSSRTRRWPLGLTTTTQRLRLDAVPEALQRRRSPKVFALKRRRVCTVQRRSSAAGSAARPALAAHRVLRGGGQGVQRPVRLALPRDQVYRVVGGRTRAEQRVALGAHHTAGSRR